MTRAPVRFMAYAGLGLLAMAVLADVTDSPSLSSSGTFGAALRVSLPIGLAGLGGLWAERAGVVNIGLEGMLILGTWFGAYGGVEHGPWWGVVLGIVGGALGGLLHAVATVWFGVDHIVSGVAINLLGGGVARYLNIVVFDDQSGATQSPRVNGSLGTLDVPFLGGGDLFGWHSPNLFGWLERQDWAVVSDVGSALGGLTRGVSMLVVVCVAIFPLTWWVLWRTPFGLRLRSVGEDPAAAESLGVDVYRMKTIAVAVSGALAGLGGAVLVLVSTGIYREGQSGGRGFIGLAAMIFGNWRPGGLALGAGLFGFTDALRLQPGDTVAVHSLLLLVAAILSVIGVTQLRRSRRRAGITSLVAGAAVGAAWLFTDEYPQQFVAFTPHLVTLLVLAFASQRLRMPAADGIPYRRGQGEMTLTTAQVEAWERDGFLVVEGFVDVARCEELMARAAELVDAMDADVVSVFSTVEQTRTSDEWFLGSGDKVRAFFEEDQRAINKLGHAMHDLDPVFDGFSRAPGLAEVAAAIGMADPRLLQSMYIFKSPHVGGEVSCHQDATFLYTEPSTVVGLWFALQDATIDNGCLWAEPGGRPRPLRQRFVREGGDTEGTRFEVLDTTPLPVGGSDALLPLEAAAGTLVLLHGRLPHWSGPNRSSASRHAYSVHLIDGQAGYPDDNWLRRPASLPLRGF